MAPFLLALGMFSSAASSDYASLDLSDKWQQYLSYFALT
jgi:hypothetical protein